MPAEQRAYWEWVSTIPVDEAAALDTGLNLLAERSGHGRLYDRLVELCLRRERSGECATAMQAVNPVTPSAALYRDAAVVKLTSSADAEARAAEWKRIAASPDLEPALARIVVDEARKERESGLLEAIEEIWDAMMAEDSANAGAAFGLGYAAALRNDWDRAEALLAKAAELAPNDSQIDREFGRIYFFTGEYDPFVASLEGGIEKARRAYDIEQEVILRGNLGLGYLQWTGELEKAAEMFEKALAHEEILGMGRSAAIDRNRLANVRARQYRYDEALALLDSAQLGYETYLPDRLHEVLSLRGMVLQSIFHLTQAEDVMETALENARKHQNVVGEADALLALGHVRVQMGRYSAAREATAEALALASEYGVADYVIAAHTVLGQIERLNGDLPAAEEHFRTGLEIAEETSNVARAAEISKQLGVTALQLGDLNGARERFNAYLEFGEASDSKVAAAEAHHWIATTYLFYENDEIAVQEYEKALAALDGDEALVGLVKRNLALARYALGDRDVALALLQEARTALANDRLQGYRLDVTMGHVYLDMGEYRKALQSFSQADRSRVESEWSAVHWRAFYGQALAHWGLGNYGEAERAFREAVSIIEALRENLRHAEDRAFFVHDKTDVYDNFAAFLESRGRTAEAFHVNERARSRTLVDLLYSTQRARELDLSHATDQAIELNRRVRAVEEEIVEGALSGQEHLSSDNYRKNRSAYLRSERARADSLYRKAQLDLNGAKKLYTFDPIVADSLYSVLSDDEAVIVYTLLDREPIESTQSSVAFVITKSSIVSVALATDAENLVEAIRFFRDGLKSPADTRSWQTASSRIYQSILAPVLPAIGSGIKHLNIIPEGPMHYLPFAALMNEEGRFLVQDFTVSVAPSASILKLCRERNPKRWSYMLLLADPDGRLPGARSEVLSIASESPSRRHALVGAEASQATLENVAANYDIIHFATHGNFNSRTPWESHLELHGDPLTVDEIGDLSLDAVYLVTLSACETALSSGLVSDIPEGDEWVGLNQAFLAAGAPSVMASLWPIDDRVSESFMTDFYDNLGSDGKAVALADAQRDFIEDPATRHPFYWAAFTLIGDPM